MLEGSEWKDTRDYNFKEHDKPDWEKKMIEDQDSLFNEHLEHIDAVQSESDLFPSYETNISGGSVVSERFFVGDAPIKTDTRISPLEYTTTKHWTSEGLQCPGQVILEKLTDDALSKMSGDPVHDIALWNLQSEQNSCAVASQCFALRAEVDPGITEAQLIQEGKEKGLYRSETGTFGDDVGKLAEAHGMSREYLESSSLEQIETIQNSGGKVIALISAERMAFPRLFGFFRADHAVQIVSVDRNDPENVRVILNDPGRMDGQGISVPESTFLKAWRTSNNTIITLHKK